MSHAGQPLEMETSSSQERTPADWREVWGQLRSIEMAQGQCVRDTGLGPRSGHAVTVAGMVALCVMGSAYVVEYIGLPVSGIASSVVIPLASGVGTYLLVRFRSKRPQTWMALLDQQLLAYEPIDRDAYRRLQQRTRERGYLDTHEVYEWLCVERRAVAVAAGWRKTGSDGFLSKKV